MTVEKNHTVPLYGTPFTVFIYTSDDEFRERFKKITFDHPVDSFDGGVFRIGDRYFLALCADRKGFPTPGIVAHESKHLVNRVFVEIAHKLDPENDEPECYLLAWVVDRVHESLNKLNENKQKK